MRRADRARARAPGALGDSADGDRRQRDQCGADERRHVLRAGRIPGLRAPRGAHRAELLRLFRRRQPAENGEGLQILRYRPGAQYRPHYDYFDPAEPGTPKILERGGQRLASIVCYLNTPEAGGATVFPDAGLEVAPVQGNAVFFSYDRPHPSTRTLHGGAEVGAGEKWVATKWLREGRFE